MGGTISKWWNNFYRVFKGRTETNKLYILMMYKGKRRYFQDSENIHPWKLSKLNMYFNFGIKSTPAFKKESWSMKQDSEYLKLVKQQVQSKSLF